jgi:hypothetical protein
LIKAPCIRHANIGSDAARGEIVTISISPDKTLYKVYKDLVCYHAEYFRTAYNGRWKESEEGVVLADVEIEVFNIFLHWLYTKEIPRKRYELLRVALPAANYSGPCRKFVLYLLVKSCAFGDRFLAPKFKQDSHNQLVNLSKSAPFYELVNYAFKNLNEDDELLRFFVDSHCYHWYPELDDADEQIVRAQLPNPFLVRVMIKLFELKKSSMTQCLDKCSYHYHGSDEERRNCTYVDDADNDEG